MAKILLEPLEVFEHYHAEPSYTILLDGTADYIINNIRQPLKQFERIVTPPSTSHSLKNTGLTVCVVECGHGDGGVDCGDSRK